VWFLNPYHLSFFFSGLHHYECVAPLVANSLQSGRFWTRSTASVHDSPWESRSFCTVFIQVILVVSYHSSLAVKNTRVKYDHALHKETSRNLRRNVHHGFQHHKHLMSLETVCKVITKHSLVVFTCNTVRLFTALL